MRKLIMTVLTLALILGSISVASAATGKVKLSDIADNSNEEAIQVTYDLGIVQGTPEGAYEPDKAVNRAEFAALITRALAIPESALASYTSSTFKDTSGYGWAVPYLAVLQQRGIMKGDGYGNGMPSRTITPNEAVTMVLRAVGYTDNASVLVGQWPANYVSLGQSLNLYASVANDTQMNKASAAQMIYNVLTTQLVQVDANSTVKYLYDVDYAQTEQSLLTTSLDCNRYPGGSAKKVIDYADASNSNINLLPHVGAYGVLFRKNSDDSVVALTKVETEFLTGRFMFNLNDTTAGTFQTVDGTSYTLGKDAQAWANAFRPANLSNLTPGDAIPPPTSKSAIFINGSDFPGLTNDQSDAYVFFRGRVGTMVDSFGNTITVTRGSGDDTGLSNVHDFYDNVSAKIIVAAKVSGKTVTDILSLSAWDASPTVATSVGGAHFLYEAGQISADGKKFNGHEFPLDVNNEVDHSEYVLNGIDSLDDLSADNVVYIYKNKDGKIARIDVGTATQSGTVTNVNFTNYSRTIGGTTLYTAPWAGDNREGVDTAGNEGVALLDVYGRIYDFQLGEASKGNFAVLLNAASYFDKQVKIFDKTGSEVIYGIKDNITWTTTDTFITDTKAIAATATKPAIPGGRVANFNDLIEYKLSGSKLDVIPRVGESLPVGSAINPSGTILSISGTPNKLIDSGVVVYVRDGGDYSLGSIKDILDKKLTKAGQYIEEDGKVKALIVDVGDTGAQSVFVMITSIADASGTGGVYSYVNGLSFADGISGEIRSWDYTNHDLIATTPYNATVDYPTMVKFTIAADGVLKNSVLLKNDDTNGHFTLDSSGNYTVARPLTDPRAAIENASFVRRNSGQGGTFSITYTTTGGINTVAFEANAVIYKVDGRTWKAERPTTDVFEADKGTGVYIFLKTDKDKAYDVIIKTN